MDDLSDCASVCPVHCGKTADQIPMPFGIIGWTGPGMRQVVGFGDRSTGRGIFRGEFGARHCNQWGLYGVRVQWKGDITSRHVNTGNTVLHVSCAGGHVDVVKFLIAAYDNQRTELMHLYDDIPANLLNFDGFTPLMLAANRGNYQYIDDLHSRLL